MSGAYVRYQEERNKPKRWHGRKQKFLDPETEPNLVRCKEQVTKAEDAFRLAKADEASVDVFQEQQDRIKVLATDRDLCRSYVQGWAKRRSQRMKESQPKTPEPEVESLKAWRSSLASRVDSKPPSKKQKKVGLRIHAGTQKICNSSEFGISNWKVEEDIAEETAGDIP